MSKQSTKRDDILDAALVLLVEYDIQATAMSKIAKHANVGMGTIYNYFESKEVLLFELYRTLRQRLQEAVFVAYPTSGTYQERFFHVWRTLCHYYIAHPNEFLFGERYAASSYFSADVSQKTADLWVELEKMFAQAKAEEVLKDIRLEIILPMVSGAMSAIIRNHIQGETLIAHAAIEQAISNFRDSVKYSA
mgnify:CR=1 FL=1